MRKIIGGILSLALAVLPAAGAPLESAWLDAAMPFDNVAANNSTVNAGGFVVNAPVRHSSGFSATLALKKTLGALPHIFGPGGAPTYHEKPTGIGPVTWEQRPGYLHGLLGGLFGLLLAPIAFALETIQAVALTPVRMAKGLANGDPLAILDPLRTVKNVAQDALMTTVGLLNCAAAPVWNAINSDEHTDFMYANNRLIFSGGPVAGIMGTWAVGIAPSWHTVFTDYPRPEDSRGGYEHEFVHNKQWEKSFFMEHIVEPHGTFEGWDDADAHEYLNW